MYNIWININRDIKLIDMSKISLNTITDEKRDWLDLITKPFPCHPCMMSAKRSVISTALSRCFNTPYLRSKEQTSVVSLT